MYVSCQRVASVGRLGARQRLCSASSISLIVRRRRLSTVGDRTFPVAGPRLGNALPQYVISALSLPVFSTRRQWRIQDFRTGGAKDEAPQAPRSSRRRREDRGAEGAEVERRRREDRGAEGAEGVG